MPEQTANSRTCDICGGYLVVINKRPCEPKRETDIPNHIRRRTKCRQCGARDTTREYREKDDPYFQSR